MSEPTLSALQAAYEVEAAAPFCGEWLKIKIIKDRANVTEDEAREALTSARTALDVDEDYGDDGVEDEVGH